MFVFGHSFALPGLRAWPESVHLQIQHGDGQFYGTQPKSTLSLGETGTSRSRDHKSVCVLVFRKASPPKEERKPGSAYSLKNGLHKAGNYGICLDKNKYILEKPFYV